MTKNEIKKLLYNILSIKFEYISRFHYYADHLNDFHIYYNKNSSIFITIGPRIKINNILNILNKKSNYGFISFYDMSDRQISFILYNHLKNIYI